MIKIVIKGKCTILKKVQDEGQEAVKPEIHICKSLKGIVCIFCFLLFEIIRNITGNGHCPKMCMILEVKPRIICFLTEFENHTVSEESYVFLKQQPF